MVLGCTLDLPELSVPDTASLRESPGGDGVGLGGLGLGLGVGVCWCSSPAFKFSFAWIRSCRNEESV